MGFGQTTGVVIYWEYEKLFIIKKYNYVLFGRLNSFICDNEKQTSVYKAFQNNPDALYATNMTDLDLVPLIFGL